jgi:UDP-glucuronate 4-epimerase
MTNRILITGVAGFIGFHITRRILEEETNTYIFGIDNLSDYYDVSLKLERLDKLRNYPNFKFIRGDLADQVIVDHVFETSFDKVIHLAAQAGVRYSIDHPQDYIDSNIIGTFNILEACRHNPVQHLIYASSSSVYGQNEKVPFSTIDMTDKPVSLYAATKKSCELMAYSYSKLYGISCTGLRFFTVYGEYGRPDMAYFLFTDKMIQGKPIQLFNNGNLLRDFTYIDDIVEGILRVIKKIPNPDTNGVSHKVYNIGNHSPVSLSSFVNILENCLLNNEIIKQPCVREYLPMQDGDVYTTYAEMTEFEREFDFLPRTSLSEGLDKFAKWYKEWKGLL